MSWPEQRTVITHSQTEHYPVPAHNTTHACTDNQSWAILRYPHDFHLIHHFPRYNSELREVLEPLSSEKPQLSNLTRDSRPQFHAVGGEDVRSAPRYVHLRAETSPAATNNLHRAPSCCCGQWSDVIMRQPESRAAAWRAVQLTRSCQLVLSNVSPAHNYRMPPRVART